MAHIQHNLKVAIPKLERGPPPPPRKPVQVREDRVPRACKTCRKRKVKCTGDIPRCANCQANGLTCIYEQARRDRLKEAIELNHSFVTLFTELGEQLSEDDKKRVQAVIDAAEDDMIAPQAAPSVSSLGKRVRRTSADAISDRNSPTKTHGEADVTASVGSNEDLDFLDEDLLRTHESRETGYLGQNSEVQWLRSIQRQSQSTKGESDCLPYGPPGASEHASAERVKALHQRREREPTKTRHVTDSTFYLDSDTVELDILVNPYELPSPAIAERLLDCYMSTVHSSFPFLPPRFEDQVRKFIISLKQNKAFQVTNRWRALMNLVFAIGAKYSHLLGFEWQGDERDHLVYMTRASHLLGMNSAVMFMSEPDLLLVQAIALFSFYFLVIGHVSRAWLMIGVSIRLALALGLHLRNEDPGASATKKEVLSRTWWSLHLIECLLSSITGRPPVISNDDCTVPLPRVLSDELQPASKRRASSHFNHPSQEGSSWMGSSGNTDMSLIGTINIALLTQRALTGLYAPRTATRSWKDVQERIKNLLQNLEDWSSYALTPVATAGGFQRSDVDRETLLLQMHYLSTKILITRPCLCRTERRIKNESDASANFNSKMAGVCVRSARELTALLPREFDLEFAYTKAPWWNIVHLIMQCAAVLLLEIGYESQHAKDDKSVNTADLRKLIGWLQAMQLKDPLADRAYHVVRRILQSVAPALQHKAAEVLSGGVASETAGQQSFRPFATPCSEQQPNLDWAQGGFSGGSAPVTDRQYYPQGMVRDSQDTSQPLYEHPMYEGYSSQRAPIWNSFGNPFINHLDDGVPMVDMQNLWNDSYFTSPDMSENVNDMDQYMVQQHEPQPHDNVGVNMLYGEQSWRG